MNTKEVRDYVDELVCRASQPDFVLSEIEREHMKLVLAIYPDTLKRKTGQFMVDIGRRAPRPTLDGYDKKYPRLFLRKRRLR
jgi:hypothetical protein